MKDETAGVAMEQFVGSKANMYSYLVDDNSEHKKARGINKNFVATIIEQKLMKLTRYLCVALNIHPKQGT